MKISVVTPLSKSGNPYVAQAYASIRRAAEGFSGEWEWVVCENHGGRLPPETHRDRSRQRIRVCSSDLEGIGAIKRVTFRQARGDVLVELDHDDELAPGALAKIAAAFEAGADFAYSDFAEFKDAGGGERETQWEPDYPYGGHWGWAHYRARVGNRDYVAMRAPPATPQNLRLVDWAPNHVRAWSRATYEELGGHDPRLDVADDHDLCVRTFLAGKRMVHLPECLYLYRVHGKNNVSTQNARIRQRTWEVYERHVWALGEKFARDGGLKCVDLCGGVDAYKDYEVLDREVPPHPDLDLPWPLPDNSVGVLRASDALEHLRDPVRTMNEAYRVLAPGGLLMVSVPSTSGLGAFCDPTHVSFWNKLSFRYYADRQFARYVPAFRGRFQLWRAIEWYPSEWHRLENVPYVDAQLCCLKDGYAPMGEVKI